MSTLVELLAAFWGLLAAVVDAVAAEPLADWAVFGVLLYAVAQAVQRDR